MSQTVLSSESDRIALMQMFKAIAEYGRRVRQRREAEVAEQGPTRLTEPNQASEGHGPVQQVDT